MGQGWSAGGLSPFLTERARVRAPQVLEYAAAAGAAALISATGQVVLSCGAASDSDLLRVARAARRMGAGQHHSSFRLARACVHAGPVTGGWILCIVSLPEVAPVVTIERLRKAAHVLALALSDGGLRGPGGSAPAAVFVSAPSKRTIVSRPR